MERFRVVAGVIKEGGRFLLTRRRPTSSNPLMWEFPGGKVESGESDRKALEREIFEELSVKVKAGERLMEFRERNAQTVIDFVVYECIVKAGVPRKIDVEELGWFDIEEAKALAMTPPDRRILEFLEQRVKSF